MRRVILLTLIASLPILHGCGNRGGSSAATPPTIGTAITAAVASGDLPTLDNSTSITGTITNSNGIRDDINNYINGLNDTADGKSALRQAAVALQTSLTINTADTNALVAESQKISASVRCVFSTYSETDASNRIHNLEKYTVNTKERFIAYSKYNTALNGSVIPSVEGSGCGQ